ncbi:hypothetical protein V8G55_27275, partial [Salmonella enterica subsp. enterica serovar Kentucky]
MSLSVLLVCVNIPVEHERRLHLGSVVNNGSTEVRNIELRPELGVATAHLVEAGDAMALPLSEDKYLSLI